MKCSLLRFIILSINIVILADSSNLLFAQTVKEIDRDITLLPLEYIGLKTDNPASFAQIDLSLTNINIGYSQASGGYKNISSAETINSGIISIEGIKRLNDLTFWGLFGYDISRHINRKWNDVLFTSTANPFILADSVGGDYDDEIFNIAGGISSTIWNEKLSWGIEGVYKVGSSADQTDPRPSIDAVRYTINPGLYYNTNTLKIGISGYYSGYNERISVTLVNNNIPHYYFLMMGLGSFYPEKGGGYTRNYVGHSYGGSMQLVFITPRLENVFQAGYKNEIEKAQDGSSASLFKAGDYKNTIFSVADFFKFKANSFIHHIDIDMSTASVRGVWYDQKQVVNSNNEVVWEVYNQSVRYKERINSATLNYILEKRTNNKPDFLLSVSTDYNSHDAQLYPEGDYQRYSNLLIRLGGQKNVIFPNQFEFLVALNGLYKQNLSREANFSNVSLASVWSYPVYDYFTSDMYSTGISLRLGKTVDLYGYNFFPFVKADAKYTESSLKNNFYNNGNRTDLLVTLGAFF